MLLGFGLFAAYSVLESSFEKQLQAQIQKSFNQINLISGDLLTTLNRLNASGPRDCSDASLLELRREVFLSEYIKDIGRLEGDRLLCSAGVGRLSFPYEIRHPNYIGRLGAKVWLDMPVLLTENAVRGILVRLGAYDAVIDKTFLGDLIFIPGVEWQLIFSAEGVKEYIAGSSAASLQNADLYVHQCSDSVPYCITIGAGSEVFHQRYRSTLAGWLIIAVLVAGFGFIGQRRWLRRYRSQQSRVLRGLKNDAFYCLYQPLVELRTGRVIGCEVLARYEDVLGPIYPDSFIPVISRCRKTWPFTRLIIDKALAAVSQASALPEGFKVNINFFAQDIESGAVLALLENGRFSQPGLQFVIEVTEDEKLNSEAARINLEKLVAGGFQVAIDDFGTGYSNLRQIRDFKCDTLKIDRSFISEMEGGSVRSTLIPHIVDIAHKIDASIVAEGIENNMQNRALIDVGVRYGQGYMYGKPMPFDKLLEMISLSRQSV